MADALNWTLDYLLSGRDPKHPYTPPPLSEPVILQAGYTPPPLSAPVILYPAGSEVVAWDRVEDLPEGGAAYRLVRHYDVALSAGDGCEWVAHADNEPLAFRSSWFQAKGVKPQTCRGLYVRGDSMTPTLSDGDTVIIDVAATAVRDDRLYAVLYHGELYLKRLFRLPGGGIELRSDNPRHSTREVHGADLEHLIVLGEMIWRAG